MPVVSSIKENGEQVSLGGGGGHFWHSDLSYIETPSLGSFLYAQILPSEGGFIDPCDSLTRLLSSSL